MAQPSNTRAHTRTHASAHDAQGEKQAFYAVEVTDTFGGEANYSWVRRYRIAGSSSTAAKADRKLVRDAKKAAGWTGMTCHTTHYGDSMRVVPAGRNAPCWVMFITYDDSPLGDCEDGES